MMDLFHFLMVAALFTVILKVEGQTGTLTISADSPCVGDSLTLTCVQNGTFPAGAGYFVVFHRNRDEISSACSVDTRTPCSPTFPSGFDCGCVSSNGDVYEHKYVISPVSKNEEILWRCTRGAFPTTDTIRSQDITPDIPEGPTIPSGILALDRSGQSLTCSGPTSMGDTTLVITNETGTVLNNASSTSLTVTIPPITPGDSVTYICSLGGRGARCSSVTPVTLVASAQYVLTCDIYYDYAQTGTDATVSVKVAPPSDVTWSHSGTSTVVNQDAGTATVTLTLKANVDNGIIQVVQARAGNSNISCTLYVDVYHPSLPSGLAIGISLSSGGTVIILIVHIVQMKKAKAGAAAGGGSATASSEGDQEESGTKKSHSTPKDSQLGLAIIVLTIIFVVVTSGLIVAVAVLFGRHRESLENVFLKAFIAGWVFFGLGVLCVVVAAALGIFRYKMKHPKRLSGHEMQSSKPPEDPGNDNPSKPTTMLSPSRRLPPLRQENKETFAENGQPPHDKEKKKKKSKKEKVNGNQTRPLPQPNLGQGAHEQESQQQPPLDENENSD